MYEPGTSTTPTNEIATKINIHNAFYDEKGVQPPYTAGYLTFTAILPTYPLILGNVGDHYQPRINDHFAKSV